MKTIYKYELALRDVQRVKMPAGAVLLHVGTQRIATLEVVSGYSATADVLTLWAYVDTAAPMVDRLIGVIGTGNTAPDDLDGATYVGTAQCGAFVWHVFDGGDNHHAA